MPETPHEQRADELRLPELPSPSWRERIDGVLAVLGWSPLGLVVSALLLGAALLGGYLLLRPPPDPPEVDLPLATTVAPPTTDAVPTELVVHIAGAVGQPGVHRLPSGARVADAVEAAGGLAPDADVDRINLAAAVEDGGRVYVPRIGQTELPSVASPGGADRGSGDDAEDPLVDINTASLDELDRLPGVGPATAEAIIDHRERNGPFRSVDELIEVRGIGEAKLSQLRDRVQI